MMDLKCRACSVPVAPNSAVSLLIFNKDKIRLTEVLMQVAPITVFEDDLLPKVICLNCLDKMNSAHLFREKVIEANLKLREEIKQAYWQENNDTRLEPVIEDPLKIPEDVPFFEIKPESEVGQEDFNSESSNTIIECTVLNSSTDHSSVRKEASPQFPLNLDLVKEENDIKVELCKLSEVNLEKVTDDSPVLIPIEENVANKIQKSVKKKAKLGAGVCKKSCSSKSDGPVTCEQCGKTYKNSRSLKMHSYRHLSAGFNCDICNKWFPLKENLKKHKQIHSNERPYKCKLCDKAFKLRSSLFSHKLVHQEIKPYVCSTCGKGFRHAGALKAHERTHLGEKLFVCEFCSARFVEIKTLRRHLATHSDATLPSLPCNICGKTFKHRDNLSRHVKRIHLERQLHECGTCGKKFTEKSSVTTHMRLHTGEKPHRCKVCDKCFYHSSILRNHMRTHTGETPYPCTICEQRFAYSHHLLNHMKKKHPNADGEK